MQHAPYGSWISPLDAADLVTDRVRLGSPALDRGVAYWSQTRSDEGGRTSVWCLDGTELRELTPEVNVGSSVHEYGGRPWAVRDGVPVSLTPIEWHLAELLYQVLAQDDV